MAKLVCLLLCLAAVNYAAALSCYECPLGVGCEDADKTKWPSHKCTESPNQKPACLKQSVSMTGANNEKKSKTNRKCVVLNQDGKFECTDAPGEKTVDCKYCETDNCNSAGRISFSYMALVGVVLAYFAPKYFVQ